MILLIKHESAPTAFVANLAKALKQHLESRGHQLTTIIEANLPDNLLLFKEHANKVSETLVVATDADLESGWFRDHAVTGVKERDPVIAFFGKIDRGILDAYKALSFGPTAEACRHAFQSLCKHLSKEEFESEPSKRLDSDHYFTESSPPLGVGSGTFHEKLFRQLRSTPTVLLLAQSGRGERAFVQQLRNDAIEYYGDSAVLEFTTPSSLDVDLEELFTYLGEECNFSQVTKQYHWERELKKKVAEEGTVFLLISRFEHASPSSQTAIAKVLRGLSEELDAGKLHIVVCGGVKLVEQKFVAAEHSLLNHATAMLFPDLEVDDLIEWVHREAPEIPFTDAHALELLQRYGSHPGLLKQALGVLRRMDSSDPSRMIEAILSEAEEHRWFDQYFIPFRNSAKDAEEVCRYLTNPDRLGRFSFWPDSKVLRRLFWSNLLTTDQDNRLRWRSAAIIEAGLEILGCD